MNKVIILSGIILLMLSVGFSDIYDLNDAGWTEVFSDDFTRSNSNTVGTEWIERENTASDCSIDSNTLKVTGSGGTWTHCALNFSLAGYDASTMEIMRLTYNYTQVEALNIRTGFGNNSVWGLQFIETDVTGFFNEWNSRTTLKYLNGGSAGATYHTITEASNNKYDFVINTSNNNVSYYVNDVLVGNIISTKYGTPQQIYSFGGFDKTAYVTVDNIVLSYYDNTPAPVLDYNVTSIFDNSTSHNFEFNSSQSLNFTGYNVTGLTSQELNVQIPSLSIDQNETSNVAFSVTFDNSSVSNYSVIVTNPYNASVTETFYFTINDVKNITYSNTSSFFKQGVSQSLNFTMFLDDDTFTCNDYYNLTIPSLSITNRLVESCELTSVTFNNSLVYNYTAYLTNNRFSRTINNTKYFITNAYNLSIPVYNTTIPNNTQTDIKWYLTTLPNYASSGQSVNASIVFNGSTIYPTASGLNYTYFALQNINNIVSNLPFYLLLNITSGNESLLLNNSYSQVVTTIQLDDCSIYSNIILNISVNDEENRYTHIPNSTLTSYFNINDALIPMTITTDPDGIFQICMNNTLSFTADVDFVFIADGWGATDKLSREHFYINTYFADNTTYQQSFFKLNTSLATKKTFTVYDSNEKPLQNYYIRVKRWYGDGYETVAMAKTNNNGLAITYARFNDIAYYQTDVLDEDGVQVYSTERNLFSTENDIIRVTDADVTFFYNLADGYEYNYTFSNNTNLFRNQVSNLNFIDTNFYLKIYLMNGTQVCTESTYTSSWTVYCNLSNYENSYFYARSYAYDSNDKLISFYNVYFNNVTPSFNFGDDGMFVTFIVVLLLFLLGSSINFYIAPLLGVTGILLCRIVALNTISYYAIAGLFLPTLLLMLFFMRRT